MQQHLAPSSNFPRPIGTVATLAQMLRLPPDELIALAESADGMYRCFPGKRKGDGTRRKLTDAFNALKTVQALIQCMILRKVTFPRYLQGGIRDAEYKRGQGPNAMIHMGARTLVAADIEKFFPNVTRPVIFDIWHGFFRFPPPVADCLTKLTSKDGSLPQGSKTSALIANLVFWRYEPKLVAKLDAAGIAYSRLMDDITCSSKRDLTNAEITSIVREISGMCATRGLRLNRAKQEIARAGDRHITTKLVTNDRISLPHEQRSAIRSEVFRCAQAFERSGASAFYIRAYRGASGRVGDLQQFHEKEGVELRTILRSVKPPTAKPATAKPGGTTLQ